MIPNISNQYFNESSSYCTASTISDLENSFVLSTNKGASQFINLPSEDMNLIIFTDFPDDIHLSHLRIDPNDDIHLMSFYKNYNFPVIFTRASNVYGPGPVSYTNLTHPTILLE